MKLRIFLFVLIICSISTAQDYWRDDWQKPDMVMDSLGVKTGMTIGEVGAGDGYFTKKLAQRVGESGIIYANDIKNDFIGDMDDLCKKEGLNNIKPILGEVDDPLLPDSTMDMVIMVYVFHDLTKPVALMKNLKSALKTGAKVYIVDRDPDRYGKEYDHFLKKEDLIEKVIQAGYWIAKVYTFLPRDNIYICIPEKGPLNP